MEGSLISSRLDTSKNAYVVEYLVTSRGVERHLLTVFSLQPGRALLSMTGQARAENWKACERPIRATVDSYNLRIDD